MFILTSHHNYEITMPMFIIYQACSVNYSCFTTHNLPVDYPHDIIVNVAILLFVSLLILSTLHTDYPYFIVRLGKK